MRFPSWLGGREKLPADDGLTIRQMWDRERALALTPAHRAEIDAIFSRHA
ncbi:MAG: hypothetical protein ACKOT0_00100 [bacterium]